MPARDPKDPKEVINTPLHGIYIPCFFIILGCAFFGLNKIIYGVALAGALIAYRLVDLKFFYNKKKMVPDKFKPFELIDQTIISKDSAIYRFKLADEDDALKVPLGHHLACKFTAEQLADIGEPVDENAKDVVRYYTPISSKYDKGFFDILVKLYPTGTVSKKFAGLSVHQNVEFKGPVGRFPEEKYLTLDHCEGSKKVVMIAGGSGISPFLRILIESPMTMKFKLLYYLKTEKDVLLRKELDQVNEFKETFDLTYLFGLLTKENVTENISSKIDRDSSVLICGPPEFKQKAKDIVEEMGFDKVFVF